MDRQIGPCEGQSAPRPSEFQIAVVGRDLIEAAIE
jgi:hypothetical protein